MRMAAIQTETVSVLRAPRMRVLMGRPLRFQVSMPGTREGPKCPNSRTLRPLILPLRLGRRAMNVTQKARPGRMIFSHVVHETGSWMPLARLNFRKR
jgi:hypothetical protein